jgi:transposase InsO family protein
MKISDFALPWEKVSVDLIGPLPRTKNGNEYGLVLVDTCTGWVEAFPLRQTAATADGCATRVLSVFCRWGFPSRIISDNGPQFASELWVKVMMRLRIKTVFCTPYHPQSNPVERKNRDIKTYLRKFCHSHQKNWDEMFDVMLFALRSAKNTSTGITPAQANLGRNLTSPLDLFLPKAGYDFDSPQNLRDYTKKLESKIQASLKFLVENRELAGIEQKLYYDPSHKKAEFNEGDWVTLQAHPLSSKAKGVSASLMPKREGPYVISKKVNPLNYELSDVNSNVPITFAHVVQLKKYERRIGEPILTDKPPPKRMSFKVSKAGIGKTRGRPKGKLNVKPTAVETEPREDGPNTRSQSKTKK